MKVLSLFYLIVLPLVFTGAGRAQSTAQLTLSRVNVDTGDELAGDLTLTAPAPCDGQAYVQFIAADRSGNFP